MNCERVAIVGAGIIGLAHAWSAAQRGHRVVMFDRDSQAAGASIRNFGMIWPIGQPAGEWQELALESRARWIELGQLAGLWVNPCGSLHLAHQADEWAVLEEFADRAQPLGYDCSLLRSQAIDRLTPAANTNGLLGGLHSSSELCVNPRSILPQIAAWLRDTFDVKVRFGTHVLSIGEREAQAGIAVETSARESDRFDRVIVCGGTDCRLLFPEILDNANLRLCKLQMLRTAPQPAKWKIGPHLASGLTLRHYRNFEVCSTLTALRQRIAHELPELDEFGIHVMAAQNDSGDVILGDSHEYDGQIAPFDSAKIEGLIVRELRKVVRLPNWEIAERWHGKYVKCADGTPIFQCEPAPGVFVCTGAGGAGMTLSLGIAERNWRRWSGN